MTPRRLPLPKMPKTPAKTPAKVPARGAARDDDLDLFDFDVDVTAPTVIVAPPPDPRPTIETKRPRGRPKGAKARPTVPKVPRHFRPSDDRQGVTATTGISFPTDLLIVAKARAFERGQTFSHYLAALVKADLGTL